MKTTNTTLLLVDGNNLLHRCLLGKRELNRPSDGAPVHAAISFAQTIAALLARYKPTHGLVAFDGPGESFRVHLDPGYKGNRERRELTEADLQQVRWMRHAVEVCGMPAVDSEPYEADDVLATRATEWARRGSRVVVAGDDKDLQALVSDLVQVHLFRDGNNVTAKDVMAKRGVPPRLFSDMLAIAGDGVDGHGGVPGVGQVAAKVLLRESGSLEKILLDGPQQKAVAWSRLQASAPHMAWMGSITRLMRDADLRGRSAPLAVRRDWQLGIARFLAALEAETTLDRFCGAHRVPRGRVAPDPKVACRLRVVESRRGPRLFGRRS